MKIKIVIQNSGITLIALVITIIVLLILAGIGITIAYNLLIDKAILASNETIEQSVQEQIKLAWNECEIAYYNDKINHPTINKNEYFNENLSKYLSENNDTKNITIQINDEQSANISYQYNNQQYTLKVVKNKKTNSVCLLKENVKVGDYIDYPVEYDDVYCDKHYTSENGWIVIDDGAMNGTSGNVKIMSTGIPAKWFYDVSQYESSNQVLEELNHNFENLNFANKAGKQEIHGYSFKLEKIADKINILSLNELNSAYNKLYGTNRENDDISPLGEEDNIFNMHNEEIFYWLSVENSNELYYINKNNIKSDYDVRMGIRPVISLKENITGTKQNQVWKIDN